MPSNFKALAGASGGEPTDANFKNVTLLLHGDGSNGAQNNTFIDSSTNNFTITRNGNTTQGSFSPYGSNWSNFFDGTGDYLQTPSDTAFTFSGSLTIEFWINFSSTPSAYVALVAGTTANTQLFITTKIDGTGLRFGLTGVAEYATGSQTWAAGAWYHVALVRNGTDVRFYVNGVNVTDGTATNSTSYSGAFLLGGNVGGTVNFPGYISNLRIVKGAAVYTAAFTPPTTPLTAISGTSLLTCQSNRFRDASTNNFTITRNGDVKVTNFAPFAPSSSYSTTTNGGSAYFDGTGDYLTSTSANTANAMGTGDWTVEGWVYRTSGAADMVVFDTVGVSAASADYIRVFILTNGTVSFWRYSTAVSTTTSSIPVGTWGHFAVVRQSGAVKIYINGVQGNTTYTDTGVNYTCSASRPSLGINGYDNASNPFAGYLSNIRAVKGTAVYTAAFTPPTSPVTAITNTSLLLNATNAAIFDNSMKSDLETVGNAQISTSVKKFGTGSMAFDGTGDYLKGPNSDAFAFGAGDYTIELWMNTNADNGNVIDFRVGGNLTPYPAIYLSGGGAYFWTGTGSDGVSVGSYTKNAWVHLAVSRSGSSLKFFIDGTQTYSASNSTNLSQGTVVVGARWDAASAFAGYIDDLRVTKGIARYTANFTPPTAAFANK